MGARYFRDGIGCTASIKPRRDGCYRLVLRNPYGGIVVRRDYRSYEGARSALGRYTAGTSKEVF